MQLSSGNLLVSCLLTFCYNIHFQLVILCASSLLLFFLIAVNITKFSFQWKKLSALNKTELLYVHVFILVGALVVVPILGSNSKVSTFELLYTSNYWWVVLVIKFPYFYNCPKCNLEGEINLVMHFFLYYQHDSSSALAFQSGPNGLQFLS